MIDSLISTVPVIAPPASQHYCGKSDLYASQYGRYLDLLSSLSVGDNGESGKGEQSVGGGRVKFTVGPAVGGICDGSVGVVETDSSGVRGSSDESCDSGERRWRGVPVVNQESEKYGKHHRRNVARRNRNKKLRGDWRAGGVARPVGSCETVVSESSAEQRARETLAERRAIENKVAARKAELAYQRLHDPVVTDLYNAQQKAKGLAAMNQATARSEKSLEGLRSVSPGSSATPGEIREAMLFCETWRAKEKKIVQWLVEKRPYSEVIALIDPKASVCDGESLDSLQIQAMEMAENMNDDDRFDYSPYMSNEQCLEREREVVQNFLNAMKVGS